MENGVLFYYDTEGNKVPVDLITTCEYFLNQQSRNDVMKISSLNGKEEKHVKRMNMYKQKKLYLMYEGIAYLVKNETEDPVLDHLKNK